MYTRSSKTPQPFNDEDNQTIKEKQKSFSYILSGDAFVIVTIISLIIGTIGSLLVFVSRSSGNLVITIVTVLAGLTLLFHEDKSDYVKHSLSLGLAGILFFALALGAPYYIIYSLLIAPIFYVSSVANFKYYVPRAVLLTLLGFLGFYYLQSQYLTILYLPLLIALSVKETHKRHPKATYIYQLNKEE